MIFLACPDYGQNLRRVHLTSQWVEAIKAAIKTVHLAGVLPSSMKLIDFANSATLGVCCDTMVRQEKQFMASLMVQVSFAI